MTKPASGRILRPAARHDILRALRAINAQLRLAVDRWAIGGKVWDGGVNSGRPREQHEYPENDREQWLALADQMRDVILAAENVQRFAHEAIELIDKVRPPQ